jgi:hypothetical protein
MPRKQQVSETEIQPASITELDGFLVTIHSVRIVAKEAIFEVDTSDWTQIAPPGYVFPVWCKKATFAAREEPICVFAEFRFRDLVVELPANGDNCGYAHFQPLCIYRDDKGIRAKLRVTARLHPSMAAMLDLMLDPVDVTFSARPHTPEFPLEG